MPYLLALFFSPAYFFTNSRPIAGTISLLMFLVSIPLVFTGIGAPVAFIMWFIWSMIAIWDLRKKVAHENATVMAKALAKEFKQPTSP